MLVECVDAGVMVGTGEIELRVGVQYAVQAIVFRPDDSQQLLLRRGQSRLGWSSSAYFRTLDVSLPADWMVKVGAGGEVVVAPAAWLYPRSKLAIRVRQAQAYRFFHNEVQSIFERN